VKEDFKSSMKDLKTSIRVAKDSVDRFGKSIERLKMTCPDCKDGFYYPLIGPPETCRTCDGIVGNTPVEVKSCTNFGVQRANTVSNASTRRLSRDLRDRVQIKYYKDYVKGKNDVFVEAYGGKAGEACKTLSDAGDESSEISHHRRRATAAIQEHFLEPIYGDKVLTAAKAQDAYNELAKAGMISKSTDWSQWFPKKYHRNGKLTELFENHPIRLIDPQAESINKAIIGRMFGTLAMGNIGDFFKDRKTVYLYEIAEFLNLTPGRRLKYLSCQTLKENGFDPREL